MSDLLLVQNFTLFIFDKELHEPVVTTSLTVDEVMKIAETPLKVRNYPSHNQNTERAIQK